MIDEDKGWTISTLKELIERMIVEHDRRYIGMFEARDVAVASALAAAKEALSSALAEKEKALVLAKREADLAAAQLKEASDQYKMNVNEWQRTFREFKEAMFLETLPRGETIAAFKEHRGLIDKNAESIQEILKTGARGEGGTKIIAERRIQMNWAIGLAVAVALNMLGLVATLAYFLLGKH